MRGRGCSFKPCCNITLPHELTVLRARVFALTVYGVMETVKIGIKSFLARC